MFWFLSIILFSVSENDQLKYYKQDSDRSFFNTCRYNNLRLLLPYGKYLLILTWALQTFSVLSLQKVCQWILRKFFFDRCMFIQNFQNSLMKITIVSNTVLFSNFCQGILRKDQYWKNFSTDKVLFLRFLLGHGFWELFEWNYDGWIFQL